MSQYGLKVTNPTTDLYFNPKKQFFQLDMVDPINIITL